MQKTIEVIYEKGVFKPLTPMEKEIPECRGKNGYSLIQASWFLGDNRVGMIEKGLEQKQKGHDTKSAGRIDFLCIDTNRDFVVIVIEKWQKNAKRRN